MANLLRSLLSRDNETTPLSITDWAKQFQPGAQVSYGGRRYQAFSMTSPGPGSGYYEGNSVVFACEAKRINVFSEARFQFQRMQDGRPQDLFGTRDLSVLEEPWPGATTRDLLAVAELDVATHGNSYWVKDSDGYLLRLDPNCVKILTEAIVDPTSGYRIGERLLGYGHFAGRDEATYFDPREIAHYKPLPGTNRFLGQSWLSPCLPDIDADTQLTEHKRVQLKTGANLGYVVSMAPNVTPQQVRDFVEQYREQHEGPENAGKTLFLGGGADVKTVGQTFANLEVKATQGATETRIAACAGTPPVIVGLSEGLAGSSLNAGNYTAAKRNFVDSVMRPNWGAFSGAFQWLVSVPTGARLWYDARDIPFLREDARDEAETQGLESRTIRTLLDAGYIADSVVEAVRSGDWSRLRHSGLFSVQLQAPGTTSTSGQDEQPTEETT